MFDQRQIADLTSSGLDNLAPDNFRRAPVRAFDQHIRDDRVDNLLRRGIIEQKQVIHAGQRGKYFSTLLFGDDRSPFSFDLPDGAVGVEADDQDITHGTSLVQIAHMADVENIEAAVRENHLPALAPEPAAYLDDLIEGFELLNLHGEYCRIADACPRGNEDQNWGGAAGALTDRSDLKDPQMVQMNDTN